MLITHQGVRQQTYPGKAAPNWADAFAATKANKPQLAFHQRGPQEDSSVCGDKRLFMKMIFCLFKSRDDHRSKLYLLILSHKRTDDAGPSRSIEDVSCCRSEIH